MRLVIAWWAVFGIAWVVLLPVVTGNDVAAFAVEETIYANIQPVNSTAILERLIQVPLKLYEYKLDNTSGRQQMGFLSSDIMKVFPESVEIAAYYPLPQKDKSKPATIVSNYPLVDKSIIFMHCIGAIQAIQQKYEALAVDVKSILQGAGHDDPETEFLKKHGNALFDSGWVTSAELAMSRKAAQARESLAEIAIQRATESSVLRVGRASYRKDVRKESRTQRQQRLMEYTSEVMGRIGEIDLMRRSQLDGIKNQTLTQQHHYDMSVVDFDYADQRSRNSVDIDQMIEMVRYKVKLLMESDDEERAIALMKAKDEVYRKKMLELVDAAFAELSTLSAFTKVEPKVLIKWCAAILAVIIALTVLYEAGIFIRQYIAKKMTVTASDGARVESRQQAESGKAASSVDDLILDSSTADVLRQFGTSIKAGCGSMPLATLLVAGQPGTGRSRAYEGDGSLHAKWSLTRVCFPRRHTGKSQHFDQKAFVHQHKRLTGVYFWLRLLNGALLMIILRWLVHYRDRQTGDKCVIVAVGVGFELVIMVVIGVEVEVVAGA